MNMQRLVARACFGGVNGGGARAVRESGGARLHPSCKAMERGKQKASGHFEHGDEIPSVLCACLSLNLPSCTSGTVPL